MSAYEDGFDAGERDSFTHRMEGIRLSRPLNVKGAYTQGYWDGYCPRDPTWAYRRRTHERAAVRSSETANEVDA